jgi:hypothetical protein
MEVHRRADRPGGASDVPSLKDERAARETRVSWTFKRHEGLSFQKTPIAPEQAPVDIARQHRERKT